MGNIFSAITGAVGGFFTGGPAGAVIGGVSGFFSNGNGNGTATVPTTPIAGAGFQGIIKPKPGGPTVMAGTGITLAPGPGSGQIASSLGATALQVIQQATGRRIPAVRILEVARVCGLEQAARMLNVDVTVICRVVLERRRRRARGISAADLRRTSSTIRKINTMSRRLSELCGPVRRRSPARRRAS